MHVVSVIFIYMNIRFVLYVLDLDYFCVCVCVFFCSDSWACPRKVIYSS